MKKIILALLLTTTTASASPHLITKAEVHKIIYNTDPSLPNPSSYLGVAAIPAFIIGLPICVMSTAFIKIMRDHRALTETENRRLFINCLFPFFGGIIIDDIEKHRKPKRLHSQ